MSFQPVIPQPGLAGWRFLQRTQDSQFETFNNSTRLQRKTEYFLENIGNVASAEDLVKDRRLLEVALGAFGLAEDLDNRYFIHKILQDGTENDDALANRLSDNRYERFSKAFGFGPGETRTTGDAAAMRDIVDKFRVQSFEEAIGQQDDSMRIALFARRELFELAGEDISEDAKWFRVMGMPPLRQMFETAMGLPDAFGQLDIDRQHDIFRSKTRDALGSEAISQFTDPEAIEALSVRFLARSQIAELGPGNSSRMNALTLLQSAGFQV